MTSEEKCTPLCGLRQERKKGNQRRLTLLMVVAAYCAVGPRGSASPSEMGLIRPSADGSGLVVGPSGTPFVAWGFNYDHDSSGRLLEAYWEKEWPVVRHDLREMKQLGANVIRIHLQAGAFLAGPTSPRPKALAQLRRFLKEVEALGLYVDITGLGCYHKPEVPLWYESLPEGPRWKVQAFFWECIARIGAESNSVFCYDLMNEPIIPGAGKKETTYISGEFGGKYFVQRITLDRAGRKPAEIAEAWVRTLASAIRTYDRKHMITVGVIPWALVFPGAKPLFYGKGPSRYLDAASVHVYPRKGAVKDAVKALARYNVGKPLIVEELFPLRCSTAEALRFIEQSRSFCDGYLSFYWGKTPAEYEKEKTLKAGLAGTWLRAFSAAGKRLEGR